MFRKQDVRFPAEGGIEVRIEAVDPEGRPFTARTVTFTVPGPAPFSR